MARFKGAAAHNSDRLKEIQKRRSFDLLEREETAEVRQALGFAVEASDALTKFLGNAPAEAILKCGCAGCEHIKSSLPDLRKVAHR